MDYPHSVPDVGLLDGKFTDGDPLTGLLPSLDPASWANAVTDEFLGVIKAAGLTPDEEQSNQLLQALRRTGVFATAAQFDSSTAAATTGFVQRALGNYAGRVVTGSSRALLASECGRIITANGTFTLTLPTEGVPIGAAYQINNDGSGTVTVAAPAGSTLLGIGNSTPRNIVLGGGDSITIAAVGPATWYAWGVGQLGLSAAFSSSLTNNGYQRLPSGLLLQWGGFSPLAANTVVDLVYPIAFPTAVRNVSATLNSQAYTTTSGQASAFNLSTTHIRIANSTTIPQSVWWMAIGH
ncbi:gp53-like domain-containing protein [Chitiniphilus shinanonensis]|uniref:gp53-like domain-containing protein n=1 Tax=Chitiniphilus shinanonensis TaxID=553088 RepID=UPI003023370E